ncbi:MAG: radical SAM family heme chaperone HemW [Pseudobdellovibrionaceae bacterium]
MSFGVYIHIPYCIQRCTYCDFATYERTKILPEADYVHILKNEILSRRHLFSHHEFVDTIYFGGGTPSLLPASMISEILSTLNTAGFRRRSGTEITIEINPATVDYDKLKDYKELGINRLSVGAQTFDDSLLKMVHREHTAQETLQTFDLIQKHDFKFNFDLLFALPRQTLTGFRKDVEIAMKIGPEHLSPYCLTVPVNHLLSAHRPMDEEQVAMFEYLHEQLSLNRYYQYEISNYSRPGHESKHNLLYWTDQDYWGVGLSSHSYLRQNDKFPWGVRFWNPKGIQDYTIWAQNLTSNHEAFSADDKKLFEILQPWESLTDFCMVGLRLDSGLNQAKLSEKFGESALRLITTRLNSPLMQSFVIIKNGSWKLTRQGVHLSNKVFEQILVTEEDWSQV